jgi:hypothetical protein
MYLFRAGKAELPVTVFIQVKTGAKIIESKVNEVKDVHRYHIRQFRIVLSGPDTPDILPAPVIERAPVHVVPVFALQSSSLLIPNSPPSSLIVSGFVSC